jgi:glycosyltransferase involved in cell wall biosynthesis
MDIAVLSSEDLQSPLLSICIPTYNREKELSLLLSTIIPQCIGKQVEIVVSDNASVDDTFNVCKKYTAMYNWIKYQCQPSNLGFAKNLVSALNLAKGKYLWMLGDDELINENSVQRILSALAENEPNLMICNLSRLNKVNDNWDAYKEFSSDIDRHGLSLDNLLQITGGWVSLISVNIISSVMFNDWLNRQNTHHFSDYVGLDIILFSGSFGRCSLICNPLVGRIKQPFTTNRFEKIETYAFDFVSPLNQMVNCHKISSSIRNKIVTQAYFGMLGYKLIYKKMRGENFGPLRKWLKVHSNIPMFWVFIFPLLISPGAIVKIMIGLLKILLKALRIETSNVNRVLNAL